MANFQDPPTYAEVVLVDEITKRPAFNPIWLKWFLEVAAFISASGGGGGGGANHNDLTGLQGGASAQFYHLSSTDFSNLTGTTFAPAGRISGAQSAIASANNLVLSLGNYAPVSGATQINLISATGWAGGSKVTLKFASNPLVKHNQAVSGVNKPIMLAGAVDFATSANDTLSLVYDSIDALWYETGRAVI